MRQHVDGRFDPRLKSLHVEGVLTGPFGRSRVLLAVDTGATRTIIRSSILQAAGYDLTHTTGRADLTTAAGVVEAPLILVASLDALGTSVPVTAVAHELPRRFQGHGLLGRDFFAGLVLTIDFARSVVSLRRPGRRWWPFAG